MEALAGSFKAYQEWKGAAGPGTNSAFVGLFDF